MRNHVDASHWRLQVLRIVDVEELRGSSFRMGRARNLSLRAQLRLDERDAGTKRPDGVLLAALHGSPSSSTGLPYADAIEILAKLAQRARQRLATLRHLPGALCGRRSQGHGLRR